MQRRLRDERLSARVRLCPSSLPDLRRRFAHCNQTCQEDGSRPPAEYGAILGLSQGLEGPLAAMLTADEIPEEVDRMVSLDLTCPPPPSASTSQLNLSSEFSLARLTIFRRCPRRHVSTFGSVGLFSRRSTLDLPDLALQIEFGSLYLPSLLHSYFTATSSSSTADPWQLRDDVVYMAMGYHAGNSYPTFSRFVRENPDKALEYYRELVWRLTTGPKPVIPVRLVFYVDLLVNREESVKSAP
jgi:hypothetical protein